MCRGINNLLLFWEHVLLDGGNSEIENHCVDNENFLYLVIYGVRIRYMTNVIYLV